MDGTRLAEGCPHAATSRLWNSWARLRTQVERLTRRSDGDDLLQDAYVGMTTLAEPPRNAEAFLVRAAVNRGRDAYRREAVRGDGQACHDERACTQDQTRGPARHSIACLRDPAPLQDEIMIAHARLDRVRDGIDRLSPRTREIFLMQRLDGYKYREIADRLEISQSAVEKHMAKAMTFLADWTEDW